MKTETVLNDSCLPKIEAEIILSSIIGKDRSFLHAFGNYQLKESQVSKFASLENRRLNHEPLAYLLGYKEFYGLKLLVNKDVLIPRPETEFLVETILNYSKNKELTIVDVGTGTGCIAVSIAVNNPNLKVIATDISSKALGTAVKNAKLHQVEEKIEFIESNLLEKVEQKLDIIAANLPYIPDNNWQQLPAEIKNFEPKLALWSGKRAETFYELLFQQAKSKLKPGGKIFYEIDGKIFTKSF